MYISNKDKANVAIVTFALAIAVEILFNLVPLCFFLNLSKSFLERLLISSAEEYSFNRKMVVLLNLFPKISLNSGKIRSMAFVKSTSS